MDLPKGAEWVIKGAYKPSLRVQTAPLGRCWYLYQFGTGFQWTNTSGLNGQDTENIIRMMAVQKFVPKASVWAENIGFVWKNKSITKLLWEFSSLKLKLGGGFKNMWYFHPYSPIAEKIQFDEHIFQMGGSTTMVKKTKKQVIHPKKFNSSPLSFQNSFPFRKEGNFSSRATC